MPRDFGAKFWPAFKREQIRRLVSLIAIHGRGRGADSCLHFFLTAYDFNGKNAFTIGEFRQRRLSLTTRQPDDEVLNQKSWMRAFFLLLSKFPQFFSVQEIQGTGHDKDAWQVVANSESQVAAWIWPL